MAWTLEDFEAQMRADLRRYGHGDRGIEEWPFTADDYGKTRKRWRIFTDTNCYSFSAHYNPDDQRSTNYLGCQANCRKPRAGEDWHRGSDLADGALSMETWHRILADIVSYEMVKLHPAAEAYARVSLDMPATMGAGEGEMLVAVGDNIMRVGPGGVTLTPGA